MRFARWCSLLIAIFWLLLGLPVLFEGGDSDDQRLVEDVGGGYAMQPGIAFVLILLAGIAIVLFGLSWRSGRAGDGSLERNQVRWGIAFTAATVLGFGLLSSALTGGAGSAHCDNYYLDVEHVLGKECLRAKNALNSLGQFYLSAVIVSLILLVIVLLAARIGRRSAPLQPMEPQPRQQATPPAGDHGLVTQLRDLREMFEQGQLSEQEYKDAKRRVIGESSDGPE